MVPVDGEFGLAIHFRNALGLAMFISPFLGILISLDTIAYAIRS